MPSLNMSETSHNSQYMQYSSVLTHHPSTDQHKAISGYFFMLKSSTLSIPVTFPIDFTSSKHLFLKSVSFNSLQYLSCAKFFMLITSSVPLLESTFHVASRMQTGDAARLLKCLPSSTHTLTLGLDLQYHRNWDWCLGNGSL